MVHKNVVSSLIQVDGYFLLRHDRKTVNSSGNTKAGAGLCIFIRSTLKIDLHLQLFSSSEDLVMMAFTVRPNNQKKLLKVVCDLQTTIRKT